MAQCYPLAIRPIPFHIMPSENFKDRRHKIFFKDSFLRHHLMLQIVASVFGSLSNGLSQREVLNNNNWPTVRIVSLRASLDYDTRGVSKIGVLELHT